MKCRRIFLTYLSYYIVDFFTCIRCYGKIEVDDIISNEHTCLGIWKTQPIYVTAYSYAFGTFFMGLSSLYYVGTKHFDEFVISGEVCPLIKIHREGKEAGFKIWHISTYKMLNMSS